MAISADTSPDGGDSIPLREGLVDRLKDGKSKEGAHESEGRQHKENTDSSALVS